MSSDTWKLTTRQFLLDNRCSEIKIKQDEAEPPIPPLSVFRVAKTQMQNGAAHVAAKPAQPEEIVGQLREIPKEVSAKLKIWPQNLLLSPKNPPERGKFRNTSPQYIFKTPQYLN